jgi:hypothetical protein
MTSISMSFGLEVGWVLVLLSTDRGGVYSMGGPHAIDHRDRADRKPR